MNRAIILTEGTHDGVPVYYCYELEDVHMDLEPLVGTVDHMLSFGLKGAFTSARFRHHILTKEQYQDWQTYRGFIRPPELDA